MTHWAKAPDQMWMQSNARLGCRYPTKKEEQWWLVVGDPKSNTLLAIKRVSLLRKSKVNLAFQAPSKLGSHHLVLYFMCDSYMGCDQVCIP